MVNFQPGTCVKDVGTGWNGTVQPLPTNRSGTPVTQWQALPPGFPPDYNDSLVLIQWDNPAGGGKLPVFVFVSNSSVIALSSP